MGAVPVGGFTPLVVGQGANPNVVSSAHHIHGIINNNPTGIIDKDRQTQTDRQMGRSRVRGRVIPTTLNMVLTSPQPV